MSQPAACGGGPLQHRLGNAYALTLFVYSSRAIATNSRWPLAKEHARRSAVLVLARGIVTERPRPAIPASGSEGLGCEALEPDPPLGGTRLFNQAGNFRFPLSTLAHAGLVVSRTPARAYGRKRFALLHCCSGRKRCARAAGAQVLLRPRWSRSSSKEENMKVLSLIELLQLSRVELCDKLAQITNAHPEIPEGSAESQIARYNLRLIRRALAFHTVDPP